MLQKDGIYAMYLRKSRADLEAEARGQYETLANHLQILTELADRLGIRVHKVYREIVSGDSIEGRPEVQKLLKEVSSGIYDGVLVTEVSRLARGRTKDQGTVAEAFRSSGTLIITPSKVYDPTDDSDETYFDFELFLARQEYKYIRKRMQRGRELSRQNGNWIFPHVPCGYQKDGLRLIPDSNAPIMTAALLDFSKGRRNLKDTIYFLRSSMPERRWHGNTVRRSLTNPIYAGYMKHGKEPQNADTFDVDTYVPANCEPLISLDDHIAIMQRIIPRAPARNDFILKNAFAGLLRCSQCGRAIVYTLNHGRAVLNHQYGSDAPKCSCFPVKYDDAYKAITEQIIADLPEVQYEDDMAPDEAQIEELRKRLRRSEQIRADLFTKLEEGLYTALEFKERKNIRDEEIKGLKRQITALEGQKKRAPSVVSTSDLVDVLRNGEPSYVNELLRIFVLRIDYSKPGRHEPPHYTVVYK